MGQRHAIRLGVMSAVALGVGIAAAAPASAGPAPQAVETNYLIQLETVHNVNLPTAKHEELAVALGYLTCRVDVLGGVQPDASLVYFVAAKDTGLCNYVSTDGAGSLAAARQDLANQARLAGQAMIDDTNNSYTQQILQGPPDDDGDGVANSVDDYPHDYDPGGFQ